MRTAWMLVLASVLVGCASQTSLPGPVRAAVSARHAGHTVELRESMFYGDLYDDNEKWLLSPYPFAETYFIVDTKGAPIHPGGQRGIFPAGTRFVVQRVEFPDVAAMTTRMLTTPRYNAWVYLTPAPATIAPEGRRAFILVLPPDLETEAAAEAAVNAALAPDGEMKKWLETRRPTVRVAIENKDVVPGMTLEELTASLGPPLRWFTDVTSTGAPARVAWYPSREAWLVGGSVAAEVKPGRKLDAVAPPTGATPSPAPSPGAR
jgi:hypothetical protein